MLFFILFINLFLINNYAYALEPMPGEERFEKLKTEDSKVFSTGINFSSIEEDLFIRFAPMFDLSIGKFALGLQIPLNIRIVDNDPKSDGSFLREEDWDEGQEYLRFIRYIRYGLKREFLYVRLGILAADLGHGTILARYINNFDLDVFRIGSQFDINTKYGGFETLLSDVVNTFNEESPNSRIIALRTYIKPFRIAQLPDYLSNRFSIGVSIVSDLNAPVQLELENNGKYKINDKNNFVISQHENFFVYGIDTEFILFENQGKNIQIIPYIDFNKINEAGFGVHFGVNSNFRLSANIRLPIQIEYRYFQNNYRSIYFSTFYELERISFQQENLPKSTWIKQLSSEGYLKGYYANAAFDFLNLLQIGLIYENYNISDPNISAFLSIPALKTIRLRAYYERMNIQNAEDIFKLDDRSFLNVEARYKVQAFLYLIGRMNRLWSLDTDESSDRYSEYVGSTSYQVGLELSIPL